MYSVCVVRRVCVVCSVVRVVSCVMCVVCARWVGGVWKWRRAALTNKKSVYVPEDMYIN